MDSVTAEVLCCWAAFCLLAGGAYLAAGGGERLTDTGQLVARGWNLAILVAIGTAVAAAGYAWSRSTWPRLFAALHVRPLSAKRITLVWLMLVAWCVAQWKLADALQRL